MNNNNIYKNYKKIRKDWGNMKPYERIIKSKKYKYKNDRKYIKQKLRRDLDYD